MVNRESNMVLGGYANRFRHSPTELVAPLQNGSKDYADDYSCAWVGSLAVILGLPAWAGADSDADTIALFKNAGQSAHYLANSYG